MYLLAVAPLMIIMIIVKASEVVVDEDIQQQSVGEEQWNASFYYIPTHTTNSNEDSLDKDGLPTFNELKVSLNKYRDMTDDILYQLSRAHEVASRTEQILFPNHDTYSPSSLKLSSKLEYKITTSAKTLEANMIVLERLLKPFPINVGILPNHKPDDLNNFTFPPNNDNSNNKQCDTSSQVSTTTSIARYIAPYKEINEVNQRMNSNYNGEEEPYDTSSHILTHMTREWTESGASIRIDTHDWIVDELLTYHNQLDSSTDCQDSPLSPVLVPGAGLGRLAFDIAFTQSNRAGTNTKSQVFYPFVVEAIDNSLVMGAAAYQLFHYHHSEHDEENLKIYPMANDPFINEEDIERRWTQSVFPEEKVSDQLNLLKNMKQSSNNFQQPNISYVIGDFVSIYASPTKHGVYGSVATCFFIDTATNIYEYITTVRNLLRTGGLWINLGPVQWHRNAQLQPTTAELKDLILMAGFEIMKWEISDKLIAYRHPDDIRVGTRAEAYRPLKFVAILKPDPEECSTQDHDSTSLLSSLEKVRQVTGRKSMMIPKEVIDADISNTNSVDDDIDA